jgi:Fic family protein
MCLARSDGGAQRFYGMPSQILEERKGYYDVLEKTQAESLDITEWLTWFHGGLDRAIEQSSRISDSGLEKELFSQDLNKRNLSPNNRQKKVLNKLFSGFEGKLTRDKWMKITKASSRTVLRDIEELIAAGVIEQGEAGGRRTSYRLNRLEKSESRISRSLKPSDSCGSGRGTSLVAAYTPVRVAPERYGPLEEFL